MATPLKSANMIDFNRGKKADDADGHTNAFSKIRYRMLSALQTTLDLKTLLRVFYEEITTLVAVDSLRYMHEEHGLQQLINDPASHSCGYRLITARANLGEIIFYRNTRFTEQELQLLERTLTVLLCPLGNALQYRQAVSASMTDPLTGAGNRIALSTTLEREVGLARRDKQPLSLLIIDIDKFKSINDSKGHSAGDRVLQELATLFCAINRNTDLLYRYGGEEFVIVLKRTSAEGAKAIAERIRRHVEVSMIDYQNEKLNLTVSIGVSSFHETDNEDSLFHRADQALYTAKSVGGNQVGML